jgi:hypothetical protein
MTIFLVAFLNFSKAPKIALVIQLLRQFLGLSTLFYKSEIQGKKYYKSVFFFCQGRREVGRT